MHHEQDQEQEVNYEQLIVPLPQKLLTEGDKLTPFVCINNFTVVEILEIFEQ